MRCSAALQSLTIAALAVLVGAASASACSCAAVAPETKFRQSDAAVIARLVNVAQRGGETATFRYRVREVFKGKRRIAEGRLLSLRASAISSACGLPTEEGKRYGLFLHRENRHWAASLCDVATPRGMREAAGAAGRPSRAGPGCSA